MVGQEALRKALAEVMDPEIPTVSVLDLGVVADLVEEDGRVVVTLIPTFSACPAMRMIEERVAERLAALPGVEAVEVRRAVAPVWSTERLGPQAAERLAAFGVGLEAHGVAACPYCGSARTRLESPFGPTPCRSVYYCEDCRQPFEAMKAARTRAPFRA
jgi:ring-1,2-phenylacetyl-CoA epoxidase subunit PaaD